MLIDKYSTTIDIKLDAGVYVFDNQSSTGKTRLYKELRECQKYGENVAAYSYDDKLLGINMDTVLDSKYKVILIDRYDMFLNEKIEKITELSDTSIILIDCKHDSYLNCDVEYCYINMEPYRIEVEE